MGRWKLGSVEDRSTVLVWVKMAERSRVSAQVIENRIELKGLFPPLISGGLIEAIQMPRLEPIRSDHFRR